MSEDRRAMPKPVESSETPEVGPPPSATTEVTASSGDGDAPAALDAVPARLPPVAPAAAADGEAPASTRPGRDSSASARRRGRTALRIPDDEISRPQAASPEAVAAARATAPASFVPTPTPGRAFVPVPVPSVVPAHAPAPALASAPPPPPAEPAPVLKPMRIITINPEPAPAAPPVEIPPAPSRPRTDPEDSWTPYPAPSNPASVPEAAATRRQLPSEDMIPIESEAPPSSEPAPESLDPLEADSVPPPPPGRPVAQTEPEGEEVRFDDDAPTPAAPAVKAAISSPPPSDRDGDRRSDPGAEIEAEDLVAVESHPAPKVASLPPMRPRLASNAPVGGPNVPAAAPSSPGLSSPGAAPPAKKPLQPLPPMKAPLVIVPPHVGTVAPAPTEASGLRRKGRLWWEDLFNDDYLRTCEKLTDEQIAREVDFIEDSLSIERGGAVLDLACGTGRHAIELSRRGYEVVGFDLSLAMLARAGDEAQDRNAKLNFLQGDMREMTFEEQFDGVYCWNTSFGYFEEEKNAAVIDRIHRSLKSGGQLLLDVINRDFLIRQSPSLCWFEGDGCVCMDEMAVDFITSRMKVKRTMMLDDGRSREIEYSMRVYSLHELGKILHEHGFKVCEVSGRIATPGVFFGNESPRTIILAEKRDKK